MASTYSGFFIRSTRTSATRHVAAARMKDAVAGYTPAAPPKLKAVAAMQMINSTPWATIIISMNAMVIKIIPHTACFYVPPDPKPRK